MDSYEHTFRCSTWLQSKTYTTVFHQLMMVLKLTAFLLAQFCENVSCWMWNSYQGGFLTNGLVPLLLLATNQLYEVTAQLFIWSLIYITTSPECLMNFAAVIVYLTQVGLVVSTWLLLLTCTQWRALQTLQILFFVKSCAFLSFQTPAGWGRWLLILCPVLLRELFFFAVANMHAGLDFHSGFKKSNPAPPEPVSFFSEPDPKLTN